MSVSSHAPQADVGAVGGELRDIQDRIARGEQDLVRAVADTAERIRALERLETPPVREPKER